jgi:hypothetical protein
MCCLNGRKYSDTVSSVLEMIELDEVYKECFKKRFINEVVYYEKTSTLITWIYNTFLIISTIGGLSVPILLSLYNGNDSSQRTIYNLTLGIASTVTISNGIIKAFRLDSKFLFFMITFDKLKSEGWQYLQLTGKYKDYMDYNEAYEHFSNEVEQLQRKQHDQYYEVLKPPTTKQQGKEKRIQSSTSDIDSPTIYHRRLDIRQASANNSPRSRFKTPRRPTFHTYFDTHLEEENEQQQDLTIGKFMQKSPTDKDVDVDDEIEMSNRNELKIVINDENGDKMH